MEKAELFIVSHFYTKSIFARMMNYSSNLHSKIKFDHFQQGGGLQKVGNNMIKLVINEIDCCHKHIFKYHPRLGKKKMRKGEIKILPPRFLKTNSCVLNSEAFYIPKKYGAGQSKNAFVQNFRSKKNNDFNFSPVYFFSYKSV